ncbi:MAG: DUF6447 family protein [Thiomicrospira sp.]|jgi:molybdenum cofactor biosynthesis enzyme|nr:DUF6447 family protein [Thiomicrospira sp.]
MAEKTTTTRKTASRAKAPTKSAKSNEPTVTIDGETYLLSALSAQAIAQIQNIRMTDQRIEQLGIDLAIARTARIAYAKALSELLPVSAK